MRWDQEELAIWQDRNWKGSSMVKRGEAWKSSFSAILFNDRYTNDCNCSTAQDKQDESLGAMITIR